jgi:hypothetical protein
MILEISMRHIKTLLGILTIICGLAVCGYSQTFLTNGLMAYYPFNGNANDALGNANSGILYNGAFYTNGISGESNGAVYINGTNAYVYMGKNDTAYPNQLLTWTVWFKSEHTNASTDITSADYVFWDDDWQPDGDRGVILGGAWGGEEYAAAGNIPTQTFPQAPLFAANPMALNIWHQGVFTSDNSGQNLYIDGVLVASTNTIILNHTNRSSVSYGAGNWNASGLPNYVYRVGFKGAISKSRIYNRALSSDEVQQLYTYESLQPRLGLRFSAGQPTLSLTGMVGTVYSIQYAAVLSSSNLWVDRTLLQAQGAGTAWTDPSAPTPGQRFYRAVSVPAPADPNLVFIEPGTLTMGSPTNEALRDLDEVQHSVTISRGFWMEKFLVTQGDYLSLMTTNPSYFNGDRSGPPWNDRNYGTDLTRPVEQVSWIDATNYCGIRTQQERAGG